MYFRTILSGTLAAMLMTALPATARDAHGDHAGNRAPSGRVLAVEGLPGVFGSAARGSGEYQVAQVASDPRVTQLEEQIRALNGTIEELNFQILQLQEQVRKMQEDNEFRFQELEKKRSDAGAPKSDRAVAATTPPAAATAPAAGATPPKQAAGAVKPAPAGSIEDVIASDGGAAGSGQPPTTLGSVTFDGDGNAKTDVPAAKPSPDGTVVAALPPTDDPEELYRNSYQFILSGDYKTAETGFRDHIARFPDNNRAADANYWLGEALLGQQRYRDAAEQFLDSSKRFSKAKKAPDMLLKLGVSLIGLNQRDVACATFGEIGKRYPNASQALKDRVKQERVNASC